MAGYNPYRKANGEFASKDEVGAVEGKVEFDLREAELNGDRDKVAEIENYAMEKLPSSKLGSELLDRKYGSVPAAKPSTATSVVEAEVAPKSEVTEPPVENHSSSTVEPIRALAKPQRNRAMSHYELSDETYNINTARLMEKFYDSEGRIYELVQKTPNGSAAMFRMTDTDGNPIYDHPLRDPDQFDTFIEANDREASADLRKLVVPQNPIGSQERNPGKWSMPAAGVAIGSWEVGTERYSHDYTETGDRFYDELGNVYTVTGKDDDFTELNMTQAGERVTANGGTPMVLNRRDLYSYDALRRLKRPTLLVRFRSLFSR